jgi:hypothetical protein
MLASKFLPVPHEYLLQFLNSADLGNCNALSNQEAKIVLQRFVDSTAKANNTWVAPPLAQKAMEYLEKVEPKTDTSNSGTVEALRE